MNKLKTKEIFLYILVLLIVLLVVLYLYYNYLNNTVKTVENFSPSSGCNQIDGSENYSGQINFDSSVYETTTGSKHAFSSLNSTMNKFQPNNNLGASNLCIYELNTRGSRVKDIECISSGELQNAFSLPQFRKENVCIDEECLNIDDIKILQGNEDFQIAVGGNVMPTYDNKTSLKCLKRGIESASSCSGYPIYRGLPVLKSEKCNLSKNNKNPGTEFKFDKSWFSEKNIRRLGVNPLPNNPTYDPSSPKVDPLHR
jgi:hypothetical protein